MTHALTTGRATTLWIVLLTVATMVLTLGLACMTPFSALAALAAVHMRRRDGVALIGATWMVNQATGFCVMGYPLDASTIAWGFGIGAAALAAVVVGSLVAARVRGYAARLAAAFLSGFVAFKGVLVLCSLVLGDTAVSLSLRIAGPQLLREAGILVVLLALYHLLVAIGLPAPAKPRARLA